MATNSISLVMNYHQYNNDENETLIDQLLFCFSYSRWRPRWLPAYSDSTQLPLQKPDLIWRYFRKVDSMAVGLLLNDKITHLNP